MIDPVKDDCPSGWALTTLGEPLQWGSGGTPLSSRTDYYGGDIPWAIIGDLNDGHVSETASFITEDGLRNSSAKWVEPDSVLLAMYGSIGKLGITAIPLTTNQAIAFTNPRPISSTFLFYYLMSARADLISRGKGGTQTNISQTVVKSFPFLVAPLPEQHRIVEAIESFLTRLDDAMATLERVQRNLKRYRASVLKAAVEGRLVPTEAELARAEGREYEPASVLLERILIERRRRWEEAELAKMKAKGKVPKNDTWKAKYVEPTGPDTSELPKMPEGWCWASVDQLSVVVRGASPRPAGHPRYFGGSIPWITVGDLTRDSSPYLTQVPGTVTEAGKNASRFIEAETLLLTNSGATLGVPKITRIGGCINDGSVALLGVGDRLKLYLLYFLRTRTSALRGINQGAAQPNLNTTIVKNIVVPLPPGTEQLRIIQSIEERLDVSESLDASVGANQARSTRLRQSILKWAFEGRLVEQDPSDEPAEVLLERIRAECAAVNGKKQPRPSRVSTRSASA